MNAVLREEIIKLYWTWDSPETALYMLYTQFTYTVVQIYTTELSPVAYLISLDIRQVLKTNNFSCSAIEGLLSNVSWPERAPQIIR